MNLVGNAETVEYKVCLKIQEKIETEISDQGGNCEGVYQPLNSFTHFWPQNSSIASAFNGC